MEIELKLSVAPERWRHLLRHPVWSTMRYTDQRQRLLTYYFDTPDGALMRAGFALRIRREGRRWIQTVKGGGGSVGGLHRREEYETLVDGPTPDFDAIPRGPLQTLLLDGPVRACVGPIFTTRFSRLTRSVELADGTLAEVAFDRGEVIAGDVSTPLCEIELELRQGQVAGLLGVARALVRDGGVWPEDVSKAARGYRLLAGQSTIQPSTAEAPAERSPKRWSDLVGDALARGLRHLQANVGAVRQNDPDPEYIHQIRVAVRRLRTLVTLARRVDDSSLLKHLRRELAWLGDALSAARDWDVLIDETIPQALYQRPTPSGHRRLLSDAHARSAEARVLASAAVNSPRYAELMIDLLAWGLRLDADISKRAVRTTARNLLQRPYRQTQKLAQPERLTNDEGRHALRLACKKLRYTCEALAPAFDRARTAPFIAALAQLQTTLGALNDSAVAEQRLAELPAGRAETLRRLIVRLTRQRAEFELAALPVRWTAFMATQPFWKR